MVKGARSVNQKTVGRCHVMQHAIYIDKSRTADFQMTKGILEILKNEGNEDDLIAFMQDKNLPVDEIEALNITKDIITKPPIQGYLTISNALQWRLQYGRVIQKAGEVEGVRRVKASFNQHLLDVAETQSEPGVEPDRMADDLGRKTMAFER